MPGAKTCGHRVQDGLRSWLICICASLSAAIVPGFSYSFGVLLPHLMEHFMSDRQSTAWLGSLALALMTSIGFLSALLCDRFGCRCVTIAGSLLCVISLVTSSFVNNLIVLYFTFGILYGIGNSFVFTSGLLITPQYFTKWRSLAISIVSGGMGAGILVMGPALQELVNSLGWRGALRVMAAPTGLVVVLGLVFDENNTVSKSPPDEEESSNRETKETNEEKWKENGTSVEFQTQSFDISRQTDEAGGDKNKRYQRKKKSIDCSVWKIPLYSIITCSCIVAFLSEYVPQIHLIKYTEELNIPQHKAARLYILMGIATFLSRPLVGALCSVRVIKPQYIYQIALFGNGLATLLLPLAKGYSGVAAYVVVYGVCDGAYITMLNVLILSSLDDKRRASGFGIETCLASVTTLIGPPLAGLIADIHGSYVPAFYVGGAVSILAGSIAFLLLCCKTENSNRRRLEHDVAGVSS